MATESEGRANSIQVRLAKLGMADADRLAMQLAEFPGLFSDEQQLEELGLAPDPNLALQSLLAWSAADGKLLSRWQSDAGLRARFLMLAGSSQALGEFLVKYPNQVLAFADDSEWSEPVPRSAMITALLESVGAKWLEGRWVAAADDEAAVNAMRVAYRRQLVGIAVRDLAGAASLEQTSAALSDLADAVVAAAASIGWRAVNPGEPLSRLAVIAMGKCGGQELNYISDVDVVFVAEATGVEGDALAEATKVAGRLMAVCEEPTSEPAIWQVDAALRPEGKAGALVRTLEGHISYYQRWAETWEFQALMKARPMAGDAELGEQYINSIAPLVWQAATRPEFVTDVQAMRQRVIENIPGREAERQLKLGVGGLRDIEFAVQLLQLVHGRSDVMLRSANTLQALEALATWGYVGREDASTMAATYRFERTLEHRIQMFQMRRTHLVPESDADLRRIGRAMGMRNDPTQELLDTLRKHRVEARRLHEKLFYRPLLQAVVRLDPTDARLSMDAAQDRLKALGFADPDTALRHLSALSSGVSRRAAIQRTLLPVMLQWMAETPNPDAGLLAFRRVSDDLGATPWYLRLLRDESVVAERLAYLLSVSRYFTDLLLRSPESVALLADSADLQPRSTESLLAEMHAVASRHQLAPDAVSAIRIVRQRELIRIAAATLLDRVDLEKVCAGLTWLTDATLQASLQAVMSAHFWDREPTLRMTIIGLGRLGGSELNLGSDADVCFVYEPLSERAAADALALVASLQQLLGQPANEPPLVLDLDLRPEGRQGVVARTLDSYAAYYQRWSLTWESQALLRARFVAGDVEIGAKFIEIIDRLRYPTGGLPETELREIRRIKARVEAERLPRGANPAMHVKLGPGGISDVEWTVQLLQLEHAGGEPALRHPGTLVPLEHMTEIGLLTTAEAASLSAAWRLAGRIRNGVTLITGKPSDSIPSNPVDLRMLAFGMGYANSTELIEDYRRVARRARLIMEEKVYGKSPEVYP